jgi:hypothetical protein
MKLSRFLWTGFRWGVGAVLLLWAVMAIDQAYCGGELKDLVDRVKSVVKLEYIDHNLRLAGEISYIHEDSTAVAVYFRWVI